MQALFLVLNKVECLDDLLVKLAEAGVGGGTINGLCGSGSGMENEVGMKTGIKEMFQKWKTAGTDRLVVNML